MSRSQAKKTTNPSTTSKTKMVTLRVPNDLAERLPLENRTDWILDAIRLKLFSSKDVSAPKTEPAKIGTKYAEIVTPKGVFKTQVEAAKAYGCAKRTFSDWIRDKCKPDFYGVTRDGEIIGR